jgi:hypothetical protein
VGDQFWYQSFFNINKDLDNKNNAQIEDCLHADGDKEVLVGCVNDSQRHAELCKRFDAQFSYDFMDCEI